METYITICKRESQREFAIWFRELKQGPCDNLDGWGEEGDRSFGRDGTWVYLWLILVDVWQKTTKFYKANTLQFKKVGKKTNLWVLRKRKQGQVGSLQQNTSWSEFSVSIVTSLVDRDRAVERERALYWWQTRLHLCLMDLLRTKRWYDGRGGG